MQPNNPICHIVGAGDFYLKNMLSAREGDMLIAADGGLSHLLKNGITPDFIIGDFDSVDFSEVPPNIDVKSLPRQKNVTDMFAAILSGADKGYRLFHLHGGTGKRPDHTLANIQSLAWLSKRNAMGFLFFEDCMITAITGAAVSLKGAKGGYISVAAFGGTARGVTLSGLKYPLNDFTLEVDDVIGTSNEFAEGLAKIEVAEGTVLITCPVSACLFQVTPSNTKTS